MNKFDLVANRKNVNSLKWNVKDDELPMWVADMDFKTAEKITEVLNKRVEIGAYGYSEIPDDYFLAYKNWFKKYHGVDYEINEMVYSSGVVAAISSMVRKLTTVGEKVLVLSPVYNIFYNSILNNGRFVETSNLVYKDYKYYIDFNDLEIKMKDPQVTLMVLCNPHNPVGKIFSKEELIKIASIAYKHNVNIISDEIHCDVMTNGKKYVPFLSVSNEARKIGIACHSTSKAFNLAGLQSACIVSKNTNLRYKIWRGINTDEVGEPNFFAIEANIVALNECRDWLVDLNDYIYENKKVFISEVQKNIKNIHIELTDPTYLLWIDCTYYKMSSDELVSNLRKESKLILSSGSSYGKNGDGFLRINLATSRENILEGAKRFIQYFKQLEIKK